MPTNLVIPEPLTVGSCTSWPFSFPACLTGRPMRRFFGGGAEGSILYFAWYGAPECGQKIWSVRKRICKEANQQRANSSAGQQHGRCRAVPVRRRACDLAEGILGEDCLCPLERFIDRRRGSHPILDDVSMAIAPKLLGADLTPGWIESIVAGEGRSQHGLVHIRRPVRIFFRIEPPWIISHDLRYDRHPAAKAILEILIHHLRLHEIFHELLCRLNILGSSRDEAAASTLRGRHRRAVVAVGQTHHHRFVVIRLLVLDHREFSR